MSARVTKLIPFPSSGSRRIRGNTRGYRHDPENVGPFRLQQSPDAEGFVEDVRERVRRIDHDRRQNRFQLLPPIMGDELQMGFVQGLLFKQVDIFRRQRGKQILVPACVLTLYLPVCLLGDLLQQVFGR